MLEEEDEDSLDVAPHVGTATEEKSTSHESPDSAQAVAQAAVIGLLGPQAVAGEQVFWPGWRGLDPQVWSERGKSSILPPPRPSRPPPTATRK